MGQLLRTRWAWMPTGLEPWIGLEVDESGTIQRHHHLAPDSPVDHTLLLPGLTNAHLHLELSDQAGRVPPNEPGAPMHQWVSRSVKLRSEPNPSSMQRAAAELCRSGVRGCIDLSNGIETASILAAQGLQGTLLHELLGWDSQRWKPQLESPPPNPESSSFSQRVTAHAPISCSPELLRRALVATDIPCTIHCDESPEDEDLLCRGTGPWAEFLDRLGRPWREVRQQADSGVDLLDSLGLLGPGLGLVHLTHTRPSDLNTIAHSGSTAILCPRSNLHITGALPDVPSMLSRGIPLAIGTDSLASVENLDPLVDAAVLAANFPQVSAHHWVQALCEGGARLLARPKLGSLQVGNQPGVLSIQLPNDPNPLQRLLDGTRWERYWAA